MNKYKSEININSSSIRRDTILGSRRLSNYIIGLIMLIGSLGFLLAGISSYSKTNLLILTDVTQLPFFPQGLTLTLYGSLGFIFDCYLWLLILWNVGAGYNEFNKEIGFISIFRWGFPGKNRRIKIVCPIADAQTIRVEVKQGINPKRSIILKIKGYREIELTGVGEPIPLSTLEYDASNLANFLEIPVEAS
uniref:Photosystem I assembly protein Ycf4 n=1 Tax=Gloeochaete wittrockiana TaxID=38269 RepID=A0A3G1IW31_9EUKA|nr:photosystem I assembly protein Ycf4 [Gloeochaete wittrockiana]ASQ40264.1 photosystem I assembly protein Ycf4 [Gloeochaete wittrockiana]